MISFPTLCRRQDKVLIAETYFGNFENVNYLLNQKHGDPAFLDNLAIRIAVEYNHLQIIRRLLQDPRVDPYRAIPLLQLKISFPDSNYQKCMLNLFDYYIYRRDPNDDRFRQCFKAYFP